MAEAKAYKMIPHCTKDTITYETDELVWCKDCKWSKPEKVFKNVPTSKDMVRWCELITRYVDDDWFCADGEKADDKK